MKILAASLLIFTSSLFAQGKDSFQPLSFLEGTWAAKTQGDSAAAVVGKYTFVLEPGGHILARHATTVVSCKGPVNFDCEHGDLLYVFPEGSGLKAIYFDNEGHTIHYDVSTPTPTSAVFLSDASQPGPQFRLMYELKAGVMSGKFQMHMPGSGDWTSYLEWSGAKQ